MGIFIHDLPNHYPETQKVYSVIIDDDRIRTIFTKHSSTVDHWNSRIYSDYNGVLDHLIVDEIPSSLVEFLGDPDFTFVGVGIDEDVKKLDDDYDLEVEVVVDLRCLDADRYNSKELKNAGLMGLAGIVLNYGDTQKKTKACYYE
ncbi:uncharacterized protein LOC113333420 [Papaver somniferum]|uniref:uncharacterized protein LOC113333420 n=1 Tax=Papaver somniferum TaxID=3469 RepID=UPI000E70448C|nr:uncharacterized protein LOC113333420 [Papaver somniferum]